MSDTEIRARALELAIKHKRNELGSIHLPLMKITELFYAFLKGEDYLPFAQEIEKTIDYLIKEEEAKMKAQYENAPRVPYGIRNRIESV